MCNNQEGRTAIITGSARGIGKAIALKLASRKINIAVVDVLLEDAQKTADELSSLGITSRAYKADISNFTETESLIKKIFEDFGKIDILVNNAGITRDNLIIKMTEEDWDKVININLKGVFNCIKCVSRILMKNRWGRIINISSVVGVMGNAGQLNYSASKAGVIGMTKSAAKELASRNITCNAIAPGFIKTAMTDKLPEIERQRLESMIPLKKLGEPEDIANATAFLASDEASYITGQVLLVDGGMVM
ncbi:MAG TPA: 3-oxoacyl-[acyl-carrier-protein] reductase [bacterium]|nr:3-oxoacyl-[acyl-carrier-protein] reductase [bacterium]HPN32117.1 3-oxoacyl-[acyl-carrier-protein] reductase [bacterium]